MESTKSRRLRWLDCFLGPMNSNSKGLQENPEDADSFAEKVEMYNESRQELNNLVDNCYKHGGGELLNNIPNSGRDISTSNVTSRPLLSQLRSSKQPNAPECSGFIKKLNRGVSTKDSKNHDEIRICRKKKRRSAVAQIYYSVTHIFKFKRKS